MTRCLCPRDLHPDQLSQDPEQSPGWLLNSLRNLASPGDLLYRGRGLETLSLEVGRLGRMPPKLQDEETGVTTEPSNHHPEMHQKAGKSYIRMATTRQASSFIPHLAPAVALIFLSSPSLPTRSQTPLTDLSIYISIYMIKSTGLNPCLQFFSSAFMV